LQNLAILRGLAKPLALQGFFWFSPKENAGEKKKLYIQPLSSFEENRPFY